MTGNLLYTNFMEDSGENELLAAKDASKNLPKN